MIVGVRYHFLRCCLTDRFKRRPTNFPNHSRATNRSLHSRKLFRWEQSTRQLTLFVSRKPVEKKYRNSWKTLRPCPLTGHVSAQSHDSELFLRTSTFQRKLTSADFLPLVHYTERHPNGKYSTSSFPRRSGRRLETNI